MNLVILYGNIGKDPDVNRLQSGKIVAKFSLATNKSYTNQSGEKITETQWHNIMAWGKSAEFAEKWIKKGSSFIVEGEIQYRQYDDKDGNKKYITEIVASQFHFAGSKKEETRPENNEGKAAKGTDIESQIRNGEFKDPEPEDLNDSPF